MTATTSDLRIRYPALAEVDECTAEYWIKDAARFVTDAWGTDADPATLAYAAHFLLLNQADTSGIPAGVTRFRSASVDLAFTEASANASLAGGYAATAPGREFEIMLRRNTGGPRLVGFVDCSPCF